MKIRPLGDRILVKRIEAFGESESGNRIAKCWRNSPIVARSALIRGSLIHRYILSMLVLCVTLSLVAANAHAQEHPAATPNAARVASGWWSPDTAGSATAPRLMVSMAELTHFETSDSIRTSPPQPTGYLTEPTDGSITDLQNIGSTLNARVAEQALLADPVSLPPRSLLSLLQTRYAVWQSSLADSRSLTNVNGVSVYPLLQVNYAGWNLPVTLYISPLRGSDAR